MSSSGPPDACTSGTRPAHMNSTTLIPKCSSTIVLRPTLARLNKATRSRKGGLIMNSMREEGIPSVSVARERKESTRAESPAFRTLPARTSLMRGEASGRSRYALNARSWVACSFSGLSCNERSQRAAECGRCCCCTYRNCATLRISSSRFSNGRTARLLVSHGGYTMCARFRLSARMPG